MTHDDFSRTSRADRDGDLPFALVSSFRYPIETVKKRGKKNKLPEGFEVKPDTIMVFETHDDDCPFDTGAPCICTPTKTEITVADYLELLAKTQCKTIGETFGHGKKKH